MNSVNLKASVSFVGDGSTNRFYFGFDYINKQFVKVQVGAEGSPLTYLTDYTVDDRSVILTDTPAVGVAIRVYRETPSDRIVEWADGAFIKASQMTLESLQQLHLIEEAQDYPILNSLSRYPDGINFNALSSRIINVSDPEDPQDAVTKHYMENVQGGFIAENTKILNEAKDTLSATQQTQSKAQTNETLSKAWATSTESPDNAGDTQSSTGKTQSSRSWALYSEGKAQESAMSEEHAKTSETNAKASETKALTSEQNAKVSETNAKTSETNAKTSEQKAKTSEINAKSSETKALTSEQNAKVSETNAKTSETSSHISETNAEVYYQSAKKWAESTGSPDWEADMDSATGLTQSSRSWALYSKTKAQEANTSATNANSSETKAKTSETNAKSSETKAATSEAHAKTSEINAKSSETNAKDSETKSKASENAARVSEQNAAESARVAAENAMDFNMLKRNKAYSIGDIAYSPSLPSWARLECVKAGTTATYEPYALITTKIAGQYITDGTALFILDDVRDGNRVGDIVLKPTLNDGYIKANGATVKASEYPRLLKFAQDNNLCVSNSEWDTDSATKYVYVASSDTLKVPNAIGRVLQGGDALATKTAGLPNITGWFSVYTRDDYPNKADGAFTKTSTSDEGESYVRDGTCPKFNFDASLSNPIYGNSDTVQPPACCLIAQIKY